MILTHDTLRDNFLAPVFFGETAEAFKKYIVPKQGNWLNPQTVEQASTYIAYTIRDDSSILMPRAFDHENELGEPVHEDVVTQVAVVDLQFIGLHAEEFAKSVMHWDNRTDVIEALSFVEGQLMMESRKVVASLYYQEGANTILAFNVSFRFIWENVQEQSATVLTFAALDGDVEYE